MNSPRVVVTGAARGIGRAISERLAREGMTVFGIDQSWPEPAGCSTTADVSDRGQMELAFALALDEMGGIDVLVNNAGIILRKDLLDSEPDEWWRVLEVNLRGAFHGTQIAARQMIDSGIQGRIINITSGHAILGGYHRTAYAASKAAIESLTRNSALELGRHGILVNAVAPGFTFTEMNRHTLVGDRLRLVNQRLPIGRVAEADEVAEAVSLLAKGSLGYMTGQVLRIDGGWSVSDIEYEAFDAKD